MYSSNKVIRTISLFGAFILAVTTARAVDPPPDGGYPNETTAEGDSALFSLTTGTNNTAIGFEALFNNGKGTENTAIGHRALYSNTRGTDNTATGTGALNANTTGFFNTATGNNALDFNTGGTGNTATGTGALLSNSIGSYNTATGISALSSNTTGRGNTAAGDAALINNTTGSNNIALGISAGGELTTGNSNIEIGNKGVAGEANTVRIGKQGTQTATFVAGVSGTTVADGVGVIIDTTGHLGTVVSSLRFKDGIKPMDKSSEAILSLKPVTFRYRHDLDPDGIPQFGLVAEQVEKVNPDLVVRDEQGKPYTVRYEAVNAMLLNEFLKAHRKVEALEATVAAQQKGLESQIAALTAALKVQAAQIQKVSDQLATSDHAARMVANNR